MTDWLRYFWRLLFLKASPDDAPASFLALYLSILSYFALSAIFAGLTLPIMESMFLAAVHTGLLYFISTLSLWIRKFPQRARQTLTAVFGSGTFLILFSLLLSLNFDFSAESDFHFLFFIGMLFLIWNILVNANIFRHSLSLPYVAGLGIALVFVYMFFTITWRLMKVISISLL